MIGKEQSPVWHPFTQMKTSPAPLAVRRAEGVHLELEDGRRLVDCISSWWVNIHGHGHPLIAKAIYEQALQLEQVIFAGFTHEPAESLAKRIVALLPAKLSRVFYSDNGSTAVEVALKMACQYWYNKGERKRNRFIGFEHGYHGDTIGAMSVGGTSGFWQPFKPLMFPLDVVPFPHTYAGDQRVQQKEEQSLDALEKLLEKNSDQYAAIFIEPLIQGAGGMRICRGEFLQALAIAAKQANVLLIFDEVMTGFGRTGDWFACTRARTEPDIICLSKGISGGFLPLAQTIASEGIYRAFLGESTEKAFWHSHSYTANPLACAAGLASLKLLQSDQNQFRNFESRHWKLIDKWLADHEKLEQIRVLGTIAAMDVVCESGGYFSDLAPRLRASFVQKGFLIRPLGNTIYLMPPYCMDDETLDAAYKVIRQVVEEL